VLQIQIYRNKENKIIGYKAKGHCGYAERGKDIVCAGVSTLLQLPFISLKSYDEEVSEKFNIAVSKGNLETKIPNEYPQAILEAMVAGLEEMECQYPENVRITEEIEE
jgi:hypothetical protein